MLSDSTPLPAEPLDRRLVMRLLAQTQSLSGQRFELSSVYLNDPYEKCFRIDTADTTYKLRIATQSNPDAVSNEAAALSLMGERGFVWAPRLVESASVDGIPVMICEYLPGRTLNKSTEWHAHSGTVVNTLFSILSEMHAITDLTFGPLCGPRYATWPAYLEERLWRHVRSAERSGYVAPQDVDAIEELFNRARPHLIAVSPALAHFDIKPANLLFELEHSRLSLLDFELTRFVDPLFDFVKADLLAQHHPAYRKLIAAPLMQRAAFPSVDPHAACAHLLYAIYFLAAVVVSENHYPRDVSPQRRQLLADALQKARSWSR